MSSLLEQAIIDAAALREAAIKNAETAILNKYSSDIREAVDNLLEQEEETSDTESTESASLEDSIPYGLGAPEVAENEEIVLSMEELKDMAETLADAESDLMGDPVSHEELATNVDDGMLTPPAAPSDEVSTVSVEATLEEEIDVEDIDNILEELIVDIAPQKEGWAATPEPIMDYKEEMELARRSATKALKDVEELKAAGERLSEQNEGLKVKNLKLANAFKILKETFESAVGSVPGKARPQSLRETVERPTTTLPRRETKTRAAPQADRMQILAGIKKLK